MEFHNLGQSGLRVSALALGALNFDVQCDAARVERLVGQAVDAGVNFFDVAESYGQVRTE